MVSHSKEHYSVREECRQRTRLELLCYIGNAYFSQVSHCGIIIVQYVQGAFFNCSHPKISKCQPVSKLTPQS